MGTSLVEFVFKNTLKRFRSKSEDGKNEGNMIGEDEGNETKEEGKTKSG